MYILKYGIAPSTSIVHFFQSRKIIQLKSITAQLSYLLH